MLGTKKIRVSTYLNIDTIHFAKNGLFDGFVNFDTLLFINPCFLRKPISRPELIRKIFNNQKRLQNILSDLTLSKKIGDGDWRKARKNCVFPEYPGICLGYAKQGTSGTGISEKLTPNILYAFKNIVDSGINDPILFEIMGLFVDRIARDRVSDLSANLLAEELCQITRDFIDPFVSGTKNIKGIDYLEINGKLIPYEIKEIKNLFCRLPLNKYSGYPIILVL